MDTTTDPVRPSPSKKFNPDDDTLVSEPDTENELGDETLVSESDTENKLDDETADSESDTESKLDEGTVDSESDSESKHDDDTAVSDSDTQSAHFNDTDSDGCDGNCCNTDSNENIYNQESSDEDFVSESDSESWSNYSRQIHISGGFDLDEDYLGPLFSGIRRLSIDDVCHSALDPVKTYKTRFGEVCVEALAQYNQKHQKSLEFIRVEKANDQLVRGFLYFVTFWVKDNGVERAFRAKLLEWRTRFRIMSCRPKPEDKPCPSYYPLVRQS